MLFAGKRKARARNTLPPSQHLALATSARFPRPCEGYRPRTTFRWLFLRRQRRLLARGLVDLGDLETAYRVVREAAPPANPYYRAEFHFMAGWIALRFLATASPSSFLYPLRNGIPYCAGITG